jgi:hypothetical protein
MMGAAKHITSRAERFEQRREIIRLCVVEHVPIGELARRFDYSYSQIWNIVTGRVPTS